MEKIETNDDALKKNLEAFANQHGYHLTSKSDTIINGLKKKKEKFGNYYCPCRVQNINENICPCIHVHDDIREHGHCHCNLFEIEKKENVDEEDEY